METNQPNWVQWITMILTIIVLVGGIFYVPVVMGNAIGIAVKEGVDEIKIPTSNEIATSVLEGIEIPEVSNYEDMLNKICESETVDCYGTYVSKTEQKDISDIAFEKLIKGSDNIVKSDFKDLLDLDEVYIFDVSVRDMDEFEVTTANKDARDDGEYTIKQLVRVSWLDEDLDDTQSEYFVITSIVEDYPTDKNSDYNLVSSEISDRDFEF